MFKLLWEAQELNNFFEILFGFLRASDILEGNLFLFVTIQTCAALAKAHRLIALPLCTSEHKEQCACDQNYGQNRDTNIDPGRASIGFRFDVDLKLSIV